MNRFAVTKPEEEKGKRRDESYSVESDAEKALHKEDGICCYAPSTWIEASLRQAAKEFKGKGRALHAVVRGFLIISLLGGIYGCGVPSTATGLRAMGPERQFVFIASENYQPVYRKILDEMRRCYQMSGGGTQFLVQGDLYHDTRSGTITLAMYGKFVSQNVIWQVIDVVAIDNNQTRVIGHYGYTTESARNSYAEALKEWVLNNSPMCDR